MGGGYIDSPKKMFEAIREIGFCHLGDVQASDELEVEVPLEVRNTVTTPEEQHLKADSADIGNIKEKH